MPRMRTRINKWLRSVRPKVVRGYDSPTDDNPYALGAEARFKEGRSSLSSDRQDPIPRRNGATNSTGQLVTDRRGMPYGRNSVRGLPNRSAPIVSESSPLYHTTAPLQRPPNTPLSNPLPASSQRNVSLGSSNLTTTSSMPPHYAMAAASQGSIASMSVQSIDSSSESMPFEESEVEQDGSRTCGGVFLDPFSMMPPNIDHMLAFLAPSRQFQYVPAPMSHNVNDVVSFLATDFDLGSLSEAWTRGLQTPVESSA